MTLSTKYSSFAGLIEECGNTGVSCRIAIEQLRPVTRGGGRVGSAG